MTPDGRWIVARDNTITSSAVHGYDLAALDDARLAAFRPVWTGSGALDFGVDNSSLPELSFAVGTSWNFQFVYRDPLAGGAQFNLSAGLTVDFLP